MNTECRKARQYLEMYWNEEVQPPSWVIDHIKSCKECREYKESVEKAINELKVTLNDSVERIDPPDFSIIKNRAVTEKRRVNILKLASAITIAALILLFGFSRIFFHKPHKSPTERYLIEEDNKQFVEALFKRSVFEATTDNEEIAFSSQLFNINENYGFDGAGFRP